MNEAEIKAHEDKIIQGASVVLTGGDLPEFGVVIQTGYNKKLECKDCYVAFTGHKLLNPGEEPERKPYVLNYLASSLWLLKDFLNLEERDQRLSRKPNHWQFWPIWELARVAVRDRDKEKLAWLVKRFWDDAYDEEYVVRIFQEAAGVKDKYALHILLIELGVEY